MTEAAIDDLGEPTKGARGVVISVCCPLKGLVEATSLSELHIRCGVREHSQRSRLLSS
jgi:hypothetical protein